MSDSQESSTAGLSTLTHKSRPWTDAESAAGYVLRYLVPMRDQLIQWTGSEQLADESLKRLIAHLVTQGFGDNRKGRIRDFLMRGIRSAAKSVINELPEGKRPAVDLNAWVPDATSWLTLWRKGLLARAWRSLERIEHKAPAQPLYTALKVATQYPQEDPSMLAVRINGMIDQRVEPESIRTLLVQAKAKFAELLEVEIAESLDDLQPASIAKEVEVLGLTGVFTGR